MIHQGSELTIVVPVPAEVDLTSCAQFHDRLRAAFACGASLVIADFTATLFCDCACLRGLIAVQQQAAVRGGQLRLAMPSGSQVRRVASLLGLDRWLPVYASTDEAAGWAPRAEEPDPALLSAALCLLQVWPATPS